MADQNINDEILSVVQQMRSEFQSSDGVHKDAQKRLEAQYVELSTKHDEAIAALRKSNEELELRLERQKELAVNGEAKLTEHRSAFHQFLTAGSANNDTAYRVASGSQDPHLRSMSVGSSADGGFLAPAEFENSVVKLAYDNNPFRQIATVTTINGPALQVPRQTGKSSASWVSETGTRSETTSPTFGLTDIVAHELAANAYATQSILDDWAQAEAFLVDDLNMQFNQAELVAFTSGSGSGRPLGLMSYDTAAQTGATEVAENKIGYVATGASGAFATDAAFDNIQDVITALNPAYRANARFMMSRVTEAELVKVQDSNKNYVWQPAVAAGTPNTLRGYQVAINDQMPTIAANSLSIAFGDFRYFRIVDRKGMVMLRDPYSAKPFVQFYTTKRVGAGVTRCEAFKFMKFAAS